MSHEFYTVVGDDGPRTHSPRLRYGKGQVHSFGKYVTAKRYRAELLNANPGKKFRIIHTVFFESGDVFSEIKSSSEDDF